MGNKTATNDKATDENRMITPDELGPGPEGFEEFSSADRVAGWFKLEGGNVVSGKLRGSFETPDSFNRGKMKRTYRIEVTSDTPSKLGPTIFVDGDGNEQEATIGDLIGLDEKGFLQSLRKLGDGREVWIACYGKEPPSDQYPQGAWKFRVMVKPVAEDEPSNSTLG
jgi:hypothetical protein